MYVSFLEIAGEKEFKKYSEFISGYVKQLSDIEEALDDSLGDTWDAVLDPITLQVSDHTHYQTTPTLTQPLISFILV